MHKTSSYQSRSEALEEDKLVDFLLPSGILIPLKCKDSDNLGKVKDSLWEEAKQYPLFGLRQPEWYTLVFVNCKAEQEECLDESQKIGDLQMYKPLFKVRTLVCVTSFLDCSWAPHIASPLLLTMLSLAELDCLAVILFPS